MEKGKKNKATKIKVKNVRQWGMGSVTSQTINTSKWIRFPFFFRYQRDLSLFTSKDKRKVGETLTDILNTNQTVLSGKEKKKTYVYSGRGKWKRIWNLSPFKAKKERKKVLLDNLLLFPCYKLSRNKYAIHVVVHSALVPQHHYITLLSLI